MESEQPWETQICSNRRGKFVKFSSVMHTFSHYCRNAFLSATDKYFPLLHPLQSHSGFAVSVTSHPSWVLQVYLPAAEYYFLSVHVLSHILCILSRFSTEILTSNNVALERCFQACTFLKQDIYLAHKKNAFVPKCPYLHRFLS